jgi:hypothetical protein
MEAGKMGWQSERLLSERPYKVRAGGSLNEAGVGQRKAGPGLREESAITVSQGLIHRGL